MSLKAREQESPEVSLARQRAENDLADLENMKEERLSGIERVGIDRYGPVRHLASAVVFLSAESYETEPDKPGKGN
jgi:hypothetical protein